MVEWKTKRIETNQFGSCIEYVEVEEAEAEIKKAFDNGFEFGKEYHSKMGEDSDG